MKTRVTDLLGIEFPIIQGGLAHIATGAFAGAISSAGALGQITATSLKDPEHLIEEVKIARRITDKPFAINLAMGHLPIDDLLEIANGLKPVAISLTGGNPAPYIPKIRAAGIVSLVLVASARQAQKAAEAGADLIIAVGFEGGGHLGRDDVGTFVLTRKVVESVGIPVIASGGISDGSGLVAALALGAEGIEMGTRFLATLECPIHENYKRALLDHDECNTLVIQRSLGSPGRVLPGELVSQILDMEANGSSLEELLPWISGRKNRIGALSGDFENGYAWAGQCVGLIHDIPDVAGLINRIISEANSHFERLASIVG
jgi:enoyl-[acyl-carrier protein] reductase II